MSVTGNVARRGWPRQGQAGPGVAGSGRARLGQARLGRAGHGTARLGRAGRGVARDRMVARVRGMAFGLTAVVLVVAMVWAWWEERRHG